MSLFWMGSAALGQSLTLTGDTVLQAGVTETYTVTGATPGDRVTLFGTANTTGAPACPGPIAPTCLGIAGPMKKLGSDIADANGEATVSVSLPDPTPIGRFVVQAVQVLAAGGAATSNVMELFGEPFCGNGWVGSTEDCDDGGTTAGDGCDASCAIEVAATGDTGLGGVTAQCDACMQTNCSGPLTQLDTYCAGGVCDSYEQCADDTGCALADPVDCYCGTVDVTDCFLAVVVRDGVCAAEIEAVAGTTVPLQVGVEFYDLQTEIGAVGNTLFCRNDACATDCAGSNLPW